MAYIPLWISEIVSGLVIKPKHQIDNYNSIESEFQKYKPAQLGMFSTGFTLPIANSTDTFAFEIPYDCSIVSYTILTDQTSSCTIDVQKVSYASFNGLATVWASICGGNPIVLSSANKAKDSTLTNWSRDLLAGDLIKFVVSANSNNTRIYVNLTVKRNT